MYITVEHFSNVINTMSEVNSRLKMKKLKKMIIDTLYTFYVTINECGFAENMT